MMNTRKFTEDFLKGDFAKKNLYSHLQFGFPQPFSHKNGLAIRYLLHKFSCDKNEIIFFSPSFEIDIIYPSGIISRFVELDSIDKNNTVGFPKNKVIRLKNAFEESYATCDELLNFYNAHQFVTPIVYKKYYQQLEKISTDIGFAEWYGGLYD